ncbi:hypothetical protein HHK36_003591 [Tetracentron sinense]|uniref:Protein SCAR n=1 Tax=Tetracentron sinense TaxID=13715 RepID=A0A834ZYP8_TETSI|nr:hypothetical protein HHK36_003591 [Tetracentron sinense]
MQFASPKIYGQSPAGQTLSTFNMTLKSDLGSRSTSFDSRTRSGYVECVFDSSFSMWPEEQVDKKFCTSRLKMQCNDTLGWVLPEEQNRVADGDFPLGSLQAPSSSHVTWDEKTEIVQPTVQQCDSIVDDQSEAPELLPACSDLESIFEGNQFDEIGSEPDNYLDALNTMEAETETDFESKTKGKQSYTRPTLMIKEERWDLCDAIEMTAQNSDLSDVDSHTASHSSPTTEMSRNLFNSVSSEDSAYAHPPQITGNFSNPGSLVDTDLCGSADSLYVSKVEFSDLLFWLQNSKFTGFIRRYDLKQLVQASRISTGTKDDARDPSSHTVVPKGDGFAGTMDMFVNTPECIEKDPNSLGRRRKSPDITPPTDFPPDHLIKRTGNLVWTGNYSECSPSCHDNLDDDMFNKKKSWEFSPADLYARLEKSNNHHQSNRFSHTHRHGFKETNVMSPGAELPVAPDVKAQSTEADEDNIESSSSMIGLSHRIHVNGFRSKASPIHGDKSECSVENGVMKLQEPLCMEQKNRKKNRVAYQTSLGTTPKEQFEGGSLANSLSSSHLFALSRKMEKNRVAYQTSPGTIPKEQCEGGSLANSLSSSSPLEHMQTFFHPINGFD